MNTQEDYIRLARIAGRCITVSEQLPEPLVFDQDKMTVTYKGKAFKLSYGKTQRGEMHQDTFLSWDIEQIVLWFKAQIDPKAK